MNYMGNKSFQEQYETHKDEAAGYNPLMPDKVDLDSIQLDDVVIKPSNYDKKLLDITKRMFPNKNDRDIVYAYLNSPHLNGHIKSFNDRLLNIILLYKLSGSPSMSDKSKSNFNILRSHYVPYLNRIYVYPSSFLSELSHAYLFNNPIRKPLLVKSNISSGKGTDYHRKGSIEHLAHYSIEPWLNFFVQSGDKRYLDKATLRANEEYDKYGNWLW